MLAVMSLLGMCLKSTNVCFYVCGLFIYIYIEGHLLTPSRCVVFFAGKKGESWG